MVREVHESGGSPLAESSAMKLGEATQLPLAAGALVGAVSGDTSTMDNYGEPMITMGYYGFLVLCAFLMFLCWTMIRQLVATGQCQ